jgi:FtsP/CotA-like multicopper oxidase with cupredoxin domain
MSWNRRTLLGGFAGLSAAALGREARAQAPAAPAPEPAGFTPVATLNGATLPYVLKDGVKEFRLTAEEIDHEFAPGTKVKAWGYNGRTPGPTIEAVEGDRVRILVTNRLKEHTTIHWHGVLLPNGMDGVGGLTQPHIAPGETYVYEFTLRQHGTLMYHPHADEMVQMAMGMMGLFVIHPRDGARDGARAIDRDFAMMLHNWAVHPGTYRPDPAVMTEFDLWTINSKVFPAIAPMVVRTGQKVRIRIANVSMHEHPMHMHGFRFKVTGTDGGPIPESAQWPEVTTLVPVGAIRDIEFVADAPGDWAFHCHKSHHTMNAMGHDVPNPIGVKQSDLMPKIAGLLPGYMPMGEAGMAEHQMHAMHMAGPENTMPMMTGTGPFGPLEMGGMFTLIKVRDGITSYEDPGAYVHPKGTQAYRLGGRSAAAGEAGMHHH